MLPTNIGIPGLIIILVVVLLLFGPKKLPELGRATGQTLKQFRDAISGNKSDEGKKEDSK
ncbi:twin-arginine translocase TatA/TatE family subunit [Hazenella coriacea]|uniref:Sec-independent protein translocase protein TatA n=1 Tax=Hazenella coriacea TaxID=1179467 RepID=A0A4R3LA03_9BACL|nr:twin-arginine translocase TatA/TatE family subunit [Hazenella coriacea]TCS96653.1 sec-independent protein translocase protein TatA [Hazenella coriacea]